MYNWNDDEFVHKVKITEPFRKSYHGCHTMIESCVLQLAATCRKLPQVVVSGRGNLRQVAASCRARQLAASCRKLPQVAAEAARGNLPQVAAARRRAARGKYRQLAARCC